MPANLNLKSPAARVGRVAIPVAVIALAAAACGSGSGAKTTPAAAATPVAAGSSSASVMLTTKSGSLGTYLTDGSGRTVYEFASDTATKSTCTGACLTYWPPLTSSTGASAGSGITASDIGSLTLPDGSKQVTYNGHPLYYFKLDTAPGQTMGQGLKDFGAKWWVLSPAGAPIKSSAAAAPSSTGSTQSSSTTQSSNTSTSSGSMGWGYGY